MGFQYNVEAVVDSSIIISCSICLETVTDNGDRSWAKLLCGHQFHLDCIGSAFNAKGAMQCPNCRKIEKGQWLYANGGCTFPEFNVDDWAHEEDLNDFRYSEMSLGVHWCPFNGLTRLPNSFNEGGEFPSNGYHDLLGQHASITSGSHPCPYIAYISPLNPLPSSLGTNVSDVSNFSGHWTVNESPNSYTLPSMDVHYNGWDHPSRQFTPNTEQTSTRVNQRYSRPNADIPRSVSFMQPIQVGHSSGTRAGSIASSSMIPPYPGSNARARDRVQALQAYYQRPNTTAPSSRAPVISSSPRRLSHRGGITQVGIGSVPPPSHHHHHHQHQQQQLSEFQYLPSSALSTFRNYMESENSMLNQIEMEAPTWGTLFQHPSSSSDSGGGGRVNAYRQRRGSERASSHNRS